MVPNGLPSELPGDYCVSTDEAMGYGLIISALMDDQDLFIKLLRIVDYYDNYNDTRAKKKGSGWSTHLTSWAIPSRRGEDWFNTAYFKSLSPESQKIWKDTGVRYEPLYKNQTPQKESIILGEERSVQNASGSAMDGELDIDYALYLAHAQWGTEEDTRYLDLAILRYQTIFEDMVEPFANIPHQGIDRLFLPTGDYQVTYHEGIQTVHQALSRPCDWMNAQLRTYALHSQDVRALEMIKTNQWMSEQIADSTTGLVPDFVKWVTNAKGNITLEPASSDLTHEWMSDYFYMNSARYPFRQVMDYMHYGNKHGLNQALKILDTMITKYDFNNESDYTLYPPAIHSLTGQPHPDGLWQNPVLNAGLYVTAAASGQEKYQDFINKGWDNLYTNFDSRYYDWDDNGLGYDPYHSGYFNDTWRLKAMLAMSGNWFVPQP